MKERTSNAAEGLIFRPINPSATCVVFCGIGRPPHGAQKNRGAQSLPLPPSSTTRYPQHILHSQQQPAFRMEDAEHMNEGREYNEIHM